MTVEEWNYMERDKKLIQLYQNDNNPDSHCEPEKDEPGLLFHEFIFLIALIAVESKEDISGGEGYHRQIENFFTLKLEFKEVDRENREYKTFDYYLEQAQIRAAGL